MPRSPPTGRNGRSWLACAAAPNRHYGRTCLKWAIRDEWPLRLRNVFVKIVPSILATIMLTSWAGAQGPSNSTTTVGPSAIRPSESLAAAFTPNARVCVRFDSQGRVVATAVDGRPNDRVVNRQMLALLQSRRWNPPLPGTVGRWIALAIAPDGSPVPEALPDCHRLPR